MNCCIVGGGGFVGTYLAQSLLAAGETVTLTKLPSEKESVSGCQYVNLDLADARGIREMLTSCRPDMIYHLAAQSSVARSWKDPALTVNVNILGSLNLLEAVRKSGFSPRILLIGSSEEYGKSPDAPELSEESRLCPKNPYAVTKACQNWFGALYAEAYGLDIVSVRAFNHMGPGQPPKFVVADFCCQAAAISLQQAPPVIHVGNLAAERDFTDVRDIVRAYELLAVRGKSGKTYNVGQGVAVSIQSILDEILRQCGVAVNVIHDPEKMRPIETPRLCANTQKIFRDTGWKPEIPLETTIADTLNFWRERLSLEGKEMLL